MSTTILSSVHSLQLIEVSSLAIYATKDSQTILSFRPKVRGFLTIPGSVTVSSGQTGKVYDKEIRCLSSAVGHRLGDYLYRYSNTPLVAIYTDARGMRRVCGSPEYPLNLSYTLSEGVASIVLKGKSDREDGYLMVG